LFSSPVSRATACGAGRRRPSQTVRPSVSNQAGSIITWFSGDPEPKKGFPPTARFPAPSPDLPPAPPSLSLQLQDRRHRCDSSAASRPVRRSAIGGRLRSAPLRRPEPLRVSCWLLIPRVLRSPCSPRSSAAVLAPPLGNVLPL
jgi:hypothetical protein